MHAGQPAYDQTFGYDTLDRLTNYVAPTMSESFGYDANGNRTSYTLSGASYPNTIAPSSNRLTATAGPLPARSYSYDAAGNMSSNSDTVFAYSGFGRLQSATRGGTTQYGVNALGQREDKLDAIPGYGTTMVYDQAGRLIGDYVYNSPGAVGTEIVYLGDMPVAAATPYEIFNINTDQLGAPYALTDSANRVRWRWHRDPFGKVQPEENPSGVGQVVFNLRLPGQYFDKETNTHYNYFRDYDPAQGRYVESDPIGLRGGINTYAYVSNNPLTYTDWSYPRIVDTFIFSDTSSKWAGLSYPSAE